MNAITNFRLRPEGRIFVAGFAVAALLLFLLADMLGWIGVILTIWCVFFFRDPDRITPTESGLVISPADGVGQETVNAIPPPELKMGDTPMKRIGIRVASDAANIEMAQNTIEGFSMAVMDQRPTT